MSLVASCPNCGLEVDEDAEDRCPGCSLPLKVLCSNCGEKVPADADECPACDAPLTHAVDAV
jgi:predicted amidophosphoribosyltransferase